MQQKSCKRCGERFLSVKETLCNKCKRLTNKEADKKDNIPNCPTPEKQRRLW